MATVYLARDEQHFRQVALKAFRLESDAGDGADRFLQEIKVVARLPTPTSSRCTTRGRSTASSTT